MRDFMMDMMWKALNTGAAKVKELRFAFGIPALSAVAIAARFTKDELDTRSVIIAVSMGTMLILALLMITAILNPKSEMGKPFERLYISLAWVFAALLATSAFFSATSLFFDWPGHIPSVSAKAEADYHIDSTVLLTDLTNRIAITDEKKPQSKDVKIRTDFVVKRRETQVPYEIQSGTNGLPMEDIGSITHPGMTTEEVRVPGLDPAPNTPLSVQYPQTRSL
jgi:hypothetical protein